MLSTSTKQLCRVGLIIALVVAMGVFIPAGSAHSKHHKDNAHIGHEVTVTGDVDKIYGPSTFVMDADDIGYHDHILVVSVMPNVRPRGEIKKGKDVTATGTVRLLDRAKLEHEFGKINFGSTPMKKWEGKPILVMGVRQYAEAHRPKPVQQAVVEQPQQPTIVIIQPLAEEPEVEREKPSEVEPTPETTPEETAPAAVEETPAPTKLPKTASPLPALGLVGLLSLTAGFAARRYRLAV